MTPETKTCQNCKVQFTIEPEDFAFYEKMQVPPPTWCPMCRMQRRLAIRNERYLFKRTSDFSEKEIFSGYPASAPIKVYENEVWYSDVWDPRSFAMDIDFSRPFLDQLLELFRKVPIYTLSTAFGTNSDYANNFTGFKNCYLVFDGNYAEDCMYGRGINYAKNSVDNSFLDHVENAYGNFWINRSSHLMYCSQCADSVDCYFCKNCVGCSDCFGCVNLRNKKYCFFNKSYRKEEYKKLLEQYNLGSFKVITELEEKTGEFYLHFPVKFMEGMKNTNSSGEYMYNCRNVHDSYIIVDAENVRYSSYMEIGPIKDCYDYTVWGNNAELLYECADCGLGVSNMRFCMECWSEVRNAEYSLFCQSSSDIFGCVGLRNGKYSILNKEYGEEEYKMLREKIITSMKELPYHANGTDYSYGEFFPPAFSAVPYNHTPAYEQFPLTKEEALAKGYMWEDSTEKKHEQTLLWSDLPDAIQDVKNEITKETVLCESWEKDREKVSLRNCTKAFRFHPNEIEFYRRYTTPLPRKCSNCREFDRLQKRNPARLYHRVCQCAGAKSENEAYANTTTHQHGTGRCANEFETSYSPDRKEIIYCELCYQSEVV